MQKISIIIPVYNVEKHLKRCLDSILVQSIKELQVILVNDGSTDSSETIIDEYVQKHPNIFQKINKKNGGQATARNLGIDKASRRIYSFY